MRNFCSSAIFDYLGGQMGGQNGRKTANVEVKSQKSAKMNEILNAWNYVIYTLCLQIVCFLYNNLLPDAKSSENIIKHIAATNLAGDAS